MACGTRRHSVASRDNRIIPLFQAAGVWFHRKQTSLIDGEAIEQTATPGAMESLLAAAVRGARRIPRIGIIAWAGAIGVTDLRTAGAARGPVATSPLRVPLERSTVRTRPGQDFVQLRVHLVGALGLGGLLGELARGPMKLQQVLRDQIPLGIVPRPSPDPIARVHGRRGGGRLRAQIGAPRMVAGALGFRQRLAMRIRAHETAEIPAFAEPLAGDEKPRHRFVAAHRDRCRRRVLRGARCIPRAFLGFVLLVTCGQH